jgi:hypothetical protein
MGRVVIELQPGDVDDAGNIVIGSNASVLVGVVYVSHNQAQDAKRFGWRVIGRHNGLTIIERKENERRCRKS